MSVDPKVEARQWLAEAHGELVAARAVMNDREAPPRTACFLAHLAVEKALKSLLLFHNVPFRKTHNLVQLSLLLPPNVRSVLEDQILVALDPWSQDGRYPGDVEEASEQTARRVLDDASRTLDAVTTHIESPK